MRKAINANIHVKALLSKLASDLGGGDGDEDEETRPATINSQTMVAIHKVVQNLQITVKVGPCSGSAGKRIARCIFVMPVVGVLCAQCEYTLYAPNDGKPSLAYKGRTYQD